MRRMKRTPATRLSQSGGGWLASGAARYGSATMASDGDGEERQGDRVDRHRVDGEDDAAERRAGDDADLRGDAPEGDRAGEQLGRDDLRGERARRRAADGGCDAGDRRRP